MRHSEGIEERARKLEAAIKKTIKRKYETKANLEESEAKQAIIENAMGRCYEEKRKRDREIHAKMREDKRKNRPLGFR